MVPMKRSRLLQVGLMLVLAVLTVLPVRAAEPRLVPEQDGASFGQLQEGESFTQTFRFRNVGDAPLTIQKERTSCGCTAAVLSAREIPAGETGTVTVTFNSAGFRGPVVKTVTLTVNDPHQPEVNFSLTGEVLPALELEPAQLVLEGIAPGGRAEKVVTLTNRGNRTVNLRELRTTDPAITASLNRETLAPGDSAQMTVGVKLDAEVRRVSGYVLLQTDHPTAGHLRLTVRGYVK
jgi:hypothetical protein